VELEQGLRPVLKAVFILLLPTKRCISSSAASLEPQKT